MTSFKDYYAILEIEQSATQQEVKQAYRLMAKKWHPDQNRTIDTTHKMQEIIEANLLLSDSEARRLYDIEYFRIKGKSKIDEKMDVDIDANPVINDDVLNQWMKNAQKQAKINLREVIQQFSESTYVGLSNFFNAAILGLISLLFSVILIGLIISISGK